MHFCTFLNLHWLYCSFMKFHQLFLAHLVYQHQTFTITHLSLFELWYSLFLSPNTSVFFFLLLQPAQGLFVHFFFLVGLTLENDLHGMEQLQQIWPVFFLYSCVVGQCNSCSSIHRAAVNELLSSLVIGYMGEEQLQMSCLPFPNAVPDHIGFQPVHAKVRHHCPRDIHVLL